MNRMQNELAYEAIEMAAQNDEPVDLNGSMLNLLMVNTRQFLVKDLFWCYNGEFYRAILEPQLRYGMVIPRMYVVISCTFDDTSSGNLKMFRKENRMDVLI